jgi:ribonuclease III
MSRDFSALYDRIGYHFKDPALLEHALSHRSAGGMNYERLEFLGDAVLSVIIAEALFQHHPHASEGELSRMRSILVSGVHLAELAKQLELGSYVKLGQGEIKSGGQHRESILSDTFEALLGAVYLDSDIQTCRQCVFKWYGERLNELSQMHPAKDAKSHLQEWVQAHKFPLPIYAAEVSGKPHEQIFVVTCEVTGLSHKTTGTSTSRRKAEQLAARHYLDLLS